MRRSKTSARIVIEPRPGWAGISIPEVVGSRDLLYFLAWRDVKVRYSQTALGAAWAVLQPLLMVLVFSLFFGRFAKIDSGRLSYPAFALSGLVPWTFFTNAVGGASQSLVQSANLISKVYFPRVLVPVAALLSWLPDLLIGLVIMLVGLLILGVTPGWGLLLLPVLVAAIVLAAASVSIGLAGLNVAYRDVRYAVPFLVQIWLFITPVVFPIEVVPERYRWIVALNPMTGVVEGFRWSVSGASAPAPIMLMAVSMAAIAALMVVSLAIFGRMEARFADVV